MTIGASDNKIFPVESEGLKEGGRLAKVATVTNVCKYKKGNWTSCDKIVMVRLLKMLTSMFSVL